jgi:hypothetical protein
LHFVSYLGNSFGALSNYSFNQTLADHGKDINNLFTSNLKELLKFNMLDFRKLSWVNKIKPRTQLRLLKIRFSPRQDADYVGLAAKRATTCKTNGQE